MATVKPVRPDEVQVEANFSRGMVRDTMRAQVPEGGVWNSVDFMLEQPGRAYKRGGWNLHSAVLPAAPSMVGTIHIPTRVVAMVGEDLYDVTSEVSPEAILVGDVGFVSRENPTYHVGKLIVCDASTMNRPKKIYTVGVAGDVALAALGGSPPFASASCVHAARLVLANGWDQDDTPVADQNPPHMNRVWFSPLPDIEGDWALDSALEAPAGYIDVTHEVTGMASIQGGLLVFSPNFTERINGGVPPGTAVSGTDLTGDMSLQPVGGVGCLDARSIVTTDNQVIFGSEEGIFLTNGVGFSNLMEQSDRSGILSFWRNLFVEHQERGICSGMLNRNYLYVSTRVTRINFDPPADAAAEQRENLICYLPTRTWWRSKNTTADMFSGGATEQETSELYAAMRVTPYVAKFSSTLRPAWANRADGNGVAVEPVLESRMFGSGPGLKAFGFGRLSYDMRAESGTPLLTVSQSTGIEGENYQEVVESPFPATAHAERQRFRCFRDSQGLYLKVEQEGESSETELFLAEVEHRPYALAAEGESSASTEY